MEDDTGEQRLPSTRSIDRRWDQSRSIVFEKARRNGLQDYTWDSSNAIIFAGNTAPRRAYPGRDPYANMRSTPQQNTNAVKTTTTSNLVFDPNSVAQSHRDIGKSGDNVLHQLAREKQAHGKTKQDMNEEMRQLAMKHKRELDDRINAERNNVRREMQIKLQEAQKQWQKNTEELRRKDKDEIAKRDRREQQLSEDAKKLEIREHNIDQDESRLRARKTQVDYTQRDLDERRKKVQEKEAELDNTIAQTKRRANQQAHASLKVYVERAQRKEFQASEAARLYHERFHEMSERLSKQDRERRETTLEQDTALIEHELHELRVGPNHRANVERADYTAYRKAWDTPAQLSTQLAKEFGSTTYQFTIIAPRWQQLAGSFDGKDIHPWFPVKYEKLNERLKRFLESTSSEIHRLDHDLSSAAHHYYEAKGQFQTRSHASRMLTRRSRMDSAQMHRSISSGALIAVNEEPIRQFREQSSREIDALERKTGVMSESTRRQLSNLKRDRFILRNWLSVNIKLREGMELRALLQDSPAEQKIFLKTLPIAREMQKVQRVLGGAAGIESDVGASDERRALKKRYDDLRVEMDKTVDLMRKRHIMELHLGKAGGKDDSSSKAQIEQLIGSNREEMMNLLHVLHKPPVERRIERRVRVVRSTGSRNVSFPRIALTEAPSVAQPSTKRPALEQTSLEQPPSKLSSRTLGRFVGSSHASAKRFQRACETLSIDQLIQERDAMRHEKDVHPRKLRVANFVIVQRAREERRAKTSGAPTTEPSQAVPETAHMEASADSMMQFKPSAATQAPRWFWNGDSEEEMSKTVKSTLEPGPSAAENFSDTIQPLTLSEALRSLSLRDSHASTSVETMRSDVSNSFDETSSLDRAFATPSDSGDEYTPSPALTSMEPQTDTADYFASEMSSSSSAPSSMEGESEWEDESSTVEMQETESDVHLTYQIPDEVLRRAHTASQSTMAAFWSHKLYKDANGNSPTVYYCTNLETAETRARSFLDEPVIGFDIEWEPYATPAKAGIKQNVSLIQIASESQIALFHIALFHGETADLLMPPSLRQILESRNVAKAGVNISGDASRLRQCLGVQMVGLFELSHLYRVVEFSESHPQQVNKKLFNLAGQVQTVLRLPLKKDEVRMSAWSRRLRTEQSDYAASDAYAGFRLYHALEAKRKEMRPAPPRPAFYEDMKPLQLGNGRLIIPQSQVSKRKQGSTDDTAKITEVDDDECDEFVDAVESQEYSQPSSSAESSAGSTSDVSFHSFPASQNLGVPESQPEDTQQVNVGPSKSSAASKRVKTQPSHSTAYDLAEAWVSKWCASLPIEYNLKAGRPSLRAYHMWHQQSLKCAEVAALLRDPPLALQTVASYVMEVLKHENLPFDAERIREPLEILPKSVRGRYQKVLDRMDA